MKERKKYMGLFSKKEICCICKQNEGDKKIVEGVICKDCISKCGQFLITFGWKNISSESVKQAIQANAKNQERVEMFHSTSKIEKYIELDETNRLWKVPCFSPTLIFTYDDIISYELLQDGEAITKGGLGSAVVGGALFGGVGAIVGGSIGSKKTKQEISEYRIKIITRNSCYPEIFINFLVAGKIKSGSLLYKTYTGNAQRVLSTLTVITDSVSSQPQIQSLDATDEIVKYKNLLDNGIITQEEFDAKKKQLLGL